MVKKNRDLTQSTNNALPLGENWDSHMISFFLYDIKILQIYNEQKRTCEKLVFNTNQNWKKTNSAQYPDFQLFYVYLETQFL